MGKTDKSCRSYERAIYDSDAVMGGYAEPTPGFESVLLFHGRRAPSAAFRQNVDRIVGDDVNRKNASFRAGEILTGDQVARLYKKLKPLQAIDHARRDLKQSEADPHGALQRNLDAIQALVHYALGKAGIAGFPAIGVKQLRAMAGFAALQEIDIGEDLIKLQDSLSRRLDRTVQGDVVSLRGASQELFEKWPDATPETRSAVLAELWRQTQKYAEAVYPGFALDPKRLSVTTHDGTLGSYHVLMLDGNSVICVPEKAKVPADVFNLAHEGIPGHELHSRLRVEAVRRGDAPPHVLNGLMFTRAVAMDEGWAQFTSTDLTTSGIDPELLSTIGITPLDVEIYMDTQALIHAAHAQAAYCAAEGRTEGQIEPELTRRFPLPVERLKRVERFNLNAPWGALYADLYRHGRQVVQAAIQRWGIPKTLGMLAGPHDTVSLQELLDAA